MTIETGAIYEGKVTGITKFGAFVSLPERQSGLVHISEVANTFVSDINSFLSVGQMVNVKVLSVADDGKINLSIKKAVNTDSAPQERKPAERPAPRSRDLAAEQPMPQRAASPQNGTVNEPSNNLDFEERLKKFMKESDSRIADNRLYADRGKQRRRR